MSCLIVSEETIQRVVSLVKPDIEVDAIIDELGHQLLLMNHDAYNSRYTNGNQAAYPPDSFKFDGRIASHRYSKVQMIKTLDHFLYQCSEGDIPEKNPLYKAVEVKRNWYLEEFLGDLPEYRDAEWA